MTTVYTVGIMDAHSDMGWGGGVSTPMLQCRSVHSQNEMKTRNTFYSLVNIRSTCCVVYLHFFGQPFFIYLFILRLDCSYWVLITSRQIRTKGIGVGEGLCTRGGFRVSKNGGTQQNKRCTLKQTKKVFPPLPGSASGMHRYVNALLSIRTRYYFFN